MPPRLGNKKSRRGCQRCKERKVKCDEQRPSCGWCLDHSLACNYRTSVSYGNGRDGTEAVSKVNQNSISPTSDVSSPRTTQPGSQQHLLELALLHYYIINIAPAFPHSKHNDDRQLYADVIPQEAFRWPCLLNAIYALTLLHIHVEMSTSGKKPRNTDFFEKIGLRMSAIDNQSQSIPLTPLTLHRDYLDNAIQQQRQLVANFDSTNADAVCVTSVMISQIALVHASPNVYPRVEEPYTVPLQWFVLCRSLASCFKQGIPYLTSDSTAKILLSGVPRMEHPDPNGTVTSPFDSVLIWQSPSQPEVMDHETIDAYKRSLLYIESIYRHIIEGEPWEIYGRRIIGFAVMVSDLYVTFLEQGRPRALAMLAMLFSLSKSLDDHWWIFRGVADFHLKGMASVLAEEWHWAINLPLQLLRRNAAMT